MKWEIYNKTSVWKPLSKLEYTIERRGKHISRVKGECISMRDSRKSAQIDCYSHCISKLTERLASPIQKWEYVKGDNTEIVAVSDVVSARIDVSDKGVAIVFVEDECVWVILLGKGIGLRQCVAFADIHAQMLVTHALEGALELLEGR